MPHLDVPSVRRLAAAIDHTLLDPFATAAAVDALCAEALEWSIGHVCVSPTRVAHAVERLAGSGVGVCSVVGFPSGAHLPATKASEAAAAVDAGAGEVDMVAALGALAEGNWAVVGRDIAAVVAASGRAPVKVILESAAIDADLLTAAVEVAIDAGVAWVKTSTGFHPAGGATVEAVAAMLAAAGGRCRVKASGGIRTAADAAAMLAAGAERLGTSRSVDILTTVRTGL